MAGVRIFEGPPAEAREKDLVSFLEWLGQPALFHLRGARSDRCRVVSGGLHGNEPSGFRAIHGILRDPPPLPVDAILVLGNVAAALHEEPFLHRFVPGGEDMNRVWAERTGSPLREVAASVLTYLEGRKVEALVDLHNNSGYNPIYAVILRTHSSQLALARNWTRRFVLYEGEPLGTLLETLGGATPGVTIECGKAGDPQADRDALAGVTSFLSEPSPFRLPPDDPREEHLYRSVARVHVPDGLRLVFTHEEVEADLRISPDIDRWNFEVLPAGVLLANRSARARLYVANNEGRDVTGTYLAHVNGEIRLTRPVVPVMMTTDPVAAKSDCLFYLADRSS